METAELMTKQANGELSEAELQAILILKAKAKEHPRIEPKLRSLKTRARRMPAQTIPSYEGLEGQWLAYYKVASRYEAKIPAQDRDDYRHDVMIELDRATNRDGKPLPELRAYRIASLMVALYYRELNRYATRVCIWNGYPVEPRCKGCPNSTGKSCSWLAVRPVARLDGEVLDYEGYRVKLIDTVASDRVEDMPERWYDLKKITEALPLRLAEIAYKRLEGKPLDKKDQKYLERYRKKQQLSLF